MNRQVTIVLKLVLIMAVIGLFSCKEEAPPAPQSNVVKQKITVQTPPSGQTDGAASSSSAQAGAAEPKPESQPAAEAVPQTAAPQAQPAEPSAPLAQQPEVVPPPDAVSDLIKESMQMVSTYDPKGRFDPFEPLFKEQPTEQAAMVSRDKRQKRIPQTPLEKVSLSQLKLSAVIRAPSGNRALVEDATGKGYVVEKGTYVGLNSGKVTQIDRDRIVIEEEIENVMGELTIQNSELKLQKPAGEL